MVHELRHGGQYARGYYNNFNYDVSFEIDAYRAQWGITGFIDYLPFVDMNNNINALKVGVKGNQIFTQTVTDISDINPSLIGNMYDAKGLIWTRIYDYSSSWYNSNNLGICF